MKYWSKSVLSVYKYLETLSKNLDKSIYNIGKNSNDPLVQKYQTTYFQASKMLELIERKRKIINLKVAVEEALTRLPKVERRILVLTFVDGVNSELISTLLQISMRTVFRRKLKALENFAKALMTMGIDIEYFENEYNTEQWLVSVYNEYVSKSNYNDSPLEKQLVKRLFNEVSKVDLSSKCNQF